jgi:3-oxoadipate enol-lactonase
MADHMVEIDGLRFRCRLDGQERKPWLVFSNSLLTNLAMWDAQVAALQGHFRILRYDQRGHGGTGIPPRPATFERLADDAAALLAHFRITRAVFIGLSMGGATALNLAIRHPERLGGIVVCDSQARSPASSRAAWDERIALARAEGMPTLARATVERWFRPAFVASGAPVLAEVVGMIEATAIDGFAACAYALQDYDFSPDLVRLRVPTLLVVGDETACCQPPCGHCGRRSRGPASRKFPRRGICRTWSNPGQSCRR